MYFIGEHLSGEVCWWCKLISDSEGNWRIAEGFYEMEIMPYREATTTCGSVILSRSWEKGELRLGITYHTAWAFAFGHCWKWQLGLLWPFLWQCSTLKLLQVSEKTMCLKSQKSCFDHEKELRKGKSWKERRTNKLYIQKLYLRRNNYSMKNSWCSSYLIWNKMCKFVFLIWRSSAVSLWWPMLWFIKEDVSIFERIECFQVTGKENL